MTKKDFLRVFVLVFVFLVASVALFAAGDSENNTSSGSDGFTLDNSIKKRIDSGEKPVIRVSYFNTSLEFAQKIKAGVDQAARDFQVDARLVGPADGSVSSQIAEIETLLVRGLDGLAVTASDPEAIGTIIDRTIKDGVPVVTFNSDQPNSSRLAFFGQDLYQSGVMAAREMAKHLDQGSILIFSLDAGAGWSVLRENGFRDEIRNYPDLSVLNTINAGAENAAQYAAVENAMLANQDISGIYTVDCCTTPSTGKWIQRNNQSGKIVHIGFDLTEETLDLIDSGAITVSLGQDPYSQGYKSVEALVKLLVDGEMPVDTNTGVEVVDSSNIGEYIK